MSYAFILFYTLVFADGRTVTAHRDARHVNSYKYVASMKQCNEIARTQQERISLAISDSAIDTVTVRCERRRRPFVTKLKK